MRGLPGHNIIMADGQAHRAESKGKFINTECSFYDIDLSYLIMYDAGLS